MTWLSPLTSAVFPTLAAAGQPTWSQVVDVLLLRQYNTRMTVLGVAVLGAACGVMGSYMLLRKRSLFGDALSHATLPGITIAFVVMLLLDMTGRSLPLLLLGAAGSGLLGAWLVIAVTRWTRTGEDAALGMVLSVFFGFGAAMLGVIQHLPTAGAAGLEQFVYGKPAAIIEEDLLLMAGSAVAVLLAVVLLYKEFAVLSFDSSYAASQGWPTGGIDVFMMALVTVVTVIGLQAVGLILVIALLVIPAAAARFWSEHLRTMLLASALIGAVSGWAGATISALFSDLPAGAVIVLAAGLVFVVSMLLGRSRGAIHAAVRRHQVRTRMRRQHLLRAVFEQVESQLPPGRVAHAGHFQAPPAEFPRLLAARSWSAGQLRRLINRAQRDRLLVGDETRGYRFTRDGALEADRVTRNHRLWEMYLIAHADIAPSHVDRDADMVEHILSAEQTDRLERLMLDEHPQRIHIDSPHWIDDAQPGDRAAPGDRLAESANAGSPPANVEAR